MSASYALLIETALPLWYARFVGEHPILTARETVA
jgi:hypothetical protein